MGALELRSAAASAAGAVAILGAIGLFVFLQAVGLQLRREEQRAWWAGTGRDVLNAGGVAVTAVALHLYGYPLPASLVVGATLTLMLFGTYVFMVSWAKAHRPWIGSIGVGLLLGLGVIAAPAHILLAWAMLRAWLFPPA